MPGSFGVPQKLKLDDNPGSILDFNKPAIGLDSNLIEAYFLRAISKYKLGDKRAALLDLNKSLDAKINNYNMESEPLQN